MNRTLSIIRGAALGLMLLGGGLALAGEQGQHAAAGAVDIQAKITACAVCHGPNGVSSQPAFPTLAGQHQSYLERALHDYKTGKRKNAVMAPQAATLSEAEIKALAEFFARQQGPLYTPALK